MLKRMVIELQCYFCDKLIGKGFRYENVESYIYVTCPTCSLEKENIEVMLQKKD